MRRALHAYRAYVRCYVCSHTQHMRAHAHTCCVQVCVPAHHVDSVAKHNRFARRLRADFIRSSTQRSSIAFTSNQERYNT